MSDVTLRDLRVEDAEACEAVAATLPHGGRRGAHLDGGVLTLGPSVTDEGYEGTRAFYRSVGSVPVKELSLSTWNNSHALILVRPAR